jgi:hypothetical protein
MYKHIGIALNAIALGLFFPGILLPMFSLDMTLMASISGAGHLTTDLLDKQLSILQTVENLWIDKKILVATLIALFSIVVPVLKTALILIAYFCKNPHLQRRLSNFISMVGKWSMADVFVVAVFLAVLSTDHAETSSQQSLSVFGFKLAFDISSQTLSTLGQGFYYFVAYCILALLGSQLFQLGVKRSINKEDPA